MYVTLDEYREAMGELSGVPDQDHKAWLTTNAVNLLGSSATDDPDSVLRQAQILLNDLNSYSPWSDIGRGFWGPPYSDSQTIRSNIFKAKNNANARKQTASGQAPVRVVDTAAMAPVSIYAETAKAMPEAVVARAQEIKQGDFWTAEQRQVVAAPVAMVSPSTAAAIPAATASSIPLSPPGQPAASGPSWWDRTVDWAAGTKTSAATQSAPVRAPQVMAPPAATPEPTRGQVATPVAQPSYAPVAPSYSAPPPPPPEKSFFGGADILNMVKSLTGAASQVGTAAISAQAQRDQAKIETRYSVRPTSFVIPPQRQAPSPKGLDTTTIVAIGVGVTALAGLGLFLALRSGGDEDDED